ncbi:hypothetical protein [Paralcaligenes ureilyticus]|uniref:Uncharacterized protein n=1 Tax=Paralcaligenes ureilyticus TaxID=627131 RepID=A0A4R3M158_9BURK|nr:hypothetical protein [Paralcaligenes ureilyticus]TCT06366.1 hypothetical protein EDC26_108102 [Paralcaligenes ureilyticus]
MEHFEISQRESGLHIEGFPDAVKVIAIEGPRSKRLADLALHKDDLEFADGCLDAINLSPEGPYVIREALWRSAIVHFMKCFGDSGARFQLSSAKILKGERPEASIAFKYFKHLRNKHFVHDENSYAQSLPGAILNSETKSYKIEKIVCFAAIAGTLAQENYSNLKLLIQKSRSWVISEFDQLCSTLTAELEREPYERLLKKESLAFRAPIIGEIHKNRNVP